MPEISRFFGIIIRMFIEAGGVYHRPHIHAYYQQEVGVHTIDEIELLAGGLPRTRERMVLGWAEIHREELLWNWNQLQSGSPPVKIEPLR